MEKINFQKGDLNFFKKKYPKEFKNIKPFIAPDMNSIYISSDSDFNKVESSLFYAISDTQSIDKNGELTAMGLKIERMLDYLNS